VIEQARGVEAIEIATNPYLQEFAEATSDPGSFFAYEARDILVHRYAWAILNDEALETLSALGPLVEVGAGSGYWAAVLLARGTEVLPTDKFPPHLGHNPYRHEREWTDVTAGDAAEVAGLYPERTLLLSWPPYEEDMAERALAAFESAGGTLFAYVGEGRNGCNATDEFFDRLESGWMLEKLVQLPQWFGIHDRLTIYRRKGESDA